MDSKELSIGSQDYDMWGTISAIKPPFSEETARAKVKAAQDAWNTKNPERVAQLILPILNGVTELSSSVVEKQ